eukprot:7657952-Pyramimonas_sp.AAC.1
MARSASRQGPGHDCLLNSSCWYPCPSNDAQVFPDQLDYCSTAKLGIFSPQDGTLQQAISPLAYPIP